MKLGLGFVLAAVVAVGAGCSSSSDSSDSPGAGAGGSAQAGSGGSAQAGGGSAQAGSAQAGSAQAGSAQAGSGGSSQGGSSSGGSAGSGGVFDPGGDVTTITTSIGPITVEPGGEDTRCIVRHLGNAEKVNLRRFRTKLNTGSHHMILYRSQSKVEQLEPKPCQGFSGLLTGDHAIFIAQQKNSELEFPNDDDGTPVALELAANQMVRVEMHFFNSSDQAYEVRGDIELDTIPITSKVVKSDLAFWGTQNIKIPAHSDGTTGIKFQAALAGTRTFALTTHQHHYGTRMRVWYGDGASDQGQPVADESNWSDPKLQLFTPPLTFPSDKQMGFAYQCDWKNTSDSNVSFGESVNDEMCFLWHYYYPSKGFQICIEGTCF